VILAGATACNYSVMYAVKISVYVRGYFVANFRHFNGTGSVCTCTSVLKCVRDRASLFRRFTDTNAYGTAFVKIWTTRHKISVDISVFLQCTHADSSRCPCRVVSGIRDDVSECLRVCPRSERKTTRAIDTKLGTHGLYSRISTCIDLKALPAWVCRSISQLRLIFTCSW